MVFDQILGFFLIFHIFFTFFNYSFLKNNCAYNSIFLVREVMARCTKESFIVVVLR